MQANRVLATIELCKQQNACNTVASDCLLQGPHKVVVSTLADMSCLEHVVHQHGQRT